MNAYLRLIGCGCVALGALACGSKGDGDDDGGEAGAGGTSGSSSGGTSSGGTSTGGTSGSGPLPVKTTYAFDTSEDGWAFVHSGSGMIQAGSRAGETADPVPEEDITVAHTADDGEPDPGALGVSIGYTMASQYVSIGINFATDDLTNRTITARIKVASGIGTEEALMETPGGSKIYAKSGAEYCYANGPYNNLGDGPHPIGQWQTITYNLARPPDYTDPACTFDPADVREIGIQFDTSGSIEDADVLPAEIVVDTVTY